MDPITRQDCVQCFLQIGVGIAPIVTVSCSRSRVVYVQDRTRWRIRTAATSASTTRAGLHAKYGAVEGFYQERDDIFGAGELAVADAVSEEL